MHTGTDVAEKSVGENYAVALEQMCFFPFPFCSRHAREHHISPHLGQHGKFEPRIPHVAQAVTTRNSDVRSRFSSTGCSDVASDLRRSRLTGSATPVCTGVVGPADEGAVGK